MADEDLRQKGIKKLKAQYRAFEPFGDAMQRAQGLAAETTQLIVPRRPPEQGNPGNSLDVSFDKEEREVVRTAQTFEQSARVWEFHRSMRHLNDDAAVVSVKRPRKGHDY